MLAALWTENPALVPEGYDEFILCSQIYFCTPSELLEQDPAKVARDLAFWNATQQFRKLKADEAKNKK